MIEFVDDVSGTSGGDAPQTAFTTIMYQWLRPFSDPDTGYDGYCTFDRFLRVPTAEAEARLLEQEAAFATVWDRYRRTRPDWAAITPLPDCPVTAPPTVDLGPVDDVFEDVLSRLPRPVPHIEPGYAITGMPAYLETGFATAWSEEHRGVALGDLTADVNITATASYDVDWGDGHVDEGLTDPGGPWSQDRGERGRVHHTYRHVDPDNVVTITATWVVTAHVPGVWTGSRTQPLAPTTVALPIREVQARVTSAS